MTVFCLAAADPVLLDLRGILARAVDPTDEASRMAALDGVLRGMLARFPDSRYAPAARALFGLPPAEPGQNLTVRRELAADQAGHEVHHFRKRVEPKLIETIAWELLADADRFHPLCDDRAPAGATDRAAAGPSRPPALTPAQTSRLTEAASGGVSREQFVAALHGVAGLGDAGKDDLIEAVHAAGIPGMAEEPGREIYRKHRERLGRHLLKVDRRDYRCQGDHVLTRVTRIARYDNFDEMFNHEDVASVNPLATRAEQLANIRQIYPPERKP